MKRLDVVISNNAPSAKDFLWLKPVDGGIVAYLLDAGKWEPLKLVDDNGTATIVDDAVQDLVGSVQDEKTANTINGAKAYAKDAADAVVGTEEDTKDDMTLYGLKAY